VDHGATPHERLTLVDEEADGHDLDPVRLDGDDLVVEHPRLALGPHHERHVGAVHVHVDETNGVALLLEGQGQVHGHGGLADTALARRHGHRVLDLGDEIGRGRAGPGCLWHGEACLLGRRSMRLTEV
jgi:hypothetical protein